jgi:hypothetical protein
MNLVFKGTEYKAVDVELQDSNYDSRIGECLLNSYNVAKKSNTVNIVEGFLVTKFKDGTFESVGHVWNEEVGIYFDVTLGLNKHHKNIKSNTYYIAEVYGIDDIKTEERLKPGSGMFDTDAKTEVHIVFKTNIKAMEKELRSFLNLVKE